MFLQTTNMFAEYNETQKSVNETFSLVAPSHSAGRIKDAACCLLLKHLAACAVI